MQKLGRLGRHLDIGELAVLHATMERRHITAGTVLLTAGQPNDSLFFVVKGELLVSLPFETGPLFVGTRASDSWVGEVSLLTLGVATANVTAARDSELLAISAAGLAELTDSHPTVVSHFVRAISEDLAHRLRTADVGLASAPPAAPAGFFRRVFGGLFGDAQ